MDTSQSQREMVTGGSNNRRTGWRITVAMVLALAAGSCAEKPRTKDALQYTMHGVDLTLTATAAVKIKRVVLNGRFGDGRCDSAAPLISADEGSEDIHKLPASLLAGDRATLRWNPGCGAVYKAQVKTDEDVYNLNFVP